MRNIKHKITIAFAALLPFVAGCSEQEIGRYGEQTRVVFVSNAANDDNLDFTKNCNFTSLFDDTILDSVEVRIQGLASTEDIKVYFDTEAVEGSDASEVEILDQPVTIPAGEYMAKLRFRVTRPAQSGKNYRSNLVIDYEASGLQPGLVERSKFTVVAFDNFLYEWGTDKYLKISLEDYVQYLQPHIGPPSMTKVRFMLFYPDPALTSYFGGNLANYLLYAAPPFNYGAAIVYPALSNALAYYNEANPDNPLRDENGQLVTIP